MELKINVGYKQTGKTVPVTVSDGKPLYGLKIGDSFKGELIDRTGYVFVITGGSDKSGFPMRKDVEGPQKQRVLLSGGVGFRPKRKGIRVRKTVAGNTIGEKTAQLNVFVEKEGKDPLVQAPAEAEASEE